MQLGRMEGILHRTLSNHMQYIARQVGALVGCSAPANRTDGPHYYITDRTARLVGAVKTHRKSQPPSNLSFSRVYHACIVVQLRGWGTAQFVAPAVGGVSWSSIMARSGESRGEAKVTLVILRLKYILDVVSCCIPLAFVCRLGDWAGLGVL